MSPLQTIIVAAVEGLTEFLPVSSTGHMLIAQKILGIPSGDALVKAFTVNIQFGAILAVVVLYWRRFFRSFAFYKPLLIAFLPAAVIGFALSEVIDRLLESVQVAAVALVIGGVLMVKVDRWFGRPSEDQSVGWRRALRIGFFQCIAMIPGVSRSMATIVGGMSAGLTRQNAAEFSFFLAVPTMAGAAGYSLLKVVTDPALVSTLRQNLATLLLGNVVAFLVALAAIRFFIGFLTRHGFRIFGYYRIAIGLLLLGMLLTSGIGPGAR